MISKFHRKFRQALSLPPHIAMRKAVEIFTRSVRSRLERRRDAKKTTYSDFTPAVLSQYIRAVPLPESADRRDAVCRISNLALEHRFDTLGSGAIKIEYGMDCAGVEGSRYASQVFAPQINEKNQAESERIASLLPSNYSRIDWQRDFKSGWRWSENVWHKDIRYGNMPGADVKVPWELARMLHLTTMAQAAAFAASGCEGFASPKRYAEEFAAQITDFIAANPPRFGVNWVTGMDVAIRITNWLVAYDMFRAGGAEFPEEWEQVFRRSIYEHGLHIAANLEWSSGLRGNHYLADIVGLLFCAAWLPRTPEADVWLAFAVQELTVEINLQFLSDGGNFEASVPYHRLSGEMVVYVAALIIGLPDEKRAALKEYDCRLWKFKPPLSPASKTVPERLLLLLEKLHSICSFTAGISGISHAPQIGDNDSGRFIAASHVAEILSCENGRAKFLNLVKVDDLPAEIIIPVTDDYLPLLAAAAALPGFEKYGQFALDYSAEYKLAAGLCGISSAKYFTGEREESCAQTPDRNKSAAFPDFGLWVIREGDWEFALRCGTIGQRGKGGHAHNDQLAITLNCGGRKFFVDTGTYLYTPAPEMRNRFRSTSMHNTLCIDGKEQNDWLRGGGDVLFWMLGDRSRGRVTEYSSERWSAEHRGYGMPHKRSVEWSADKIRGADECEADGKQYLMFHLAPETSVERKTQNSVIISNGEIKLRISSNYAIAVADSLYSRGYGWLQPAKALKINGEKYFSWMIEKL